MRIFDGETYRDATEEEIAALKAMQEQIPPPTPTPEERLDALENALKKGLSL